MTTKRILDMDEGLVVQDLDITGAVVDQRTVWNAEAETLHAQTERLLALDVLALTDEELAAAEAEAWASLQTLPTEKAHQAWYQLNAEAGRR